MHNAPAPAPWTSAVLAVLPTLTADAKFGDRKFFLCAVADALGTTPAAISAGLMWEMRAAGVTSQVVLARADLVAAMNPDLVSASEVHLDGATFHFVALA